MDQCGLVQLSVGVTSLTCIQQLFCADLDCGILLPFQVEVMYFLQPCIMMLTLIVWVRSFINRNPIKNIKPVSVHLLFSTGRHLLGVQAVAILEVALCTFLTRQQQPA